MYNIFSWVMYSSFSHLYFHIFSPTLYDIICCTVFPPQFSTRADGLSGYHAERTVERSWRCEKENVGFAFVSSWLQTKCRHPCPRIVWAMRTARAPSCSRMKTSPWGPKLWSSTVFLSCISSKKYKHRRNKRSQRRIFSGFSLVWALNDCRTDLTGIILVRSFSL